MQFLQIVRCYKCYKKRISQLEAHYNIYQYLFILNVIRREYPSWRRTLLSSSWFWQGERGCWSSSRYFSNIVQIFFKCLSNIFKCLTKAEYQIFNLSIFQFHPSFPSAWKRMKISAVILTPFLSLSFTQEDVEVMTATIKEFLFRAAMMVHSCILAS